MAKRLLLLLTLLTSILTASAYDFMVDGLCYDKNSDGTSVTVTYQSSSWPRYSDLSGSLTIPESVTYDNVTYSVTEIGGLAFDGCSGLTSVTIPNSVTSIGKSVFAGCSGLTSVTWNAKNCNDFVFETYGPFYCLVGINSFVFGDEVERIPYNLCRGLTGLTSVTIPNSVTYIGQGAFYDCSGLTSVTIPDSVTSIDISAFDGCSGLTSVTIGNSVTFIGHSAFNRTAWYNNQPEGLIYAGLVAYKYKGTMPEGTAITLKEGTKGIGGSAFYNCTGLTSVTIPESVTSIGDYAFDVTAWYNNQPEGLVYAGLVAYKYKGTMPEGTAITLKEGTKGIGNSAFYNCTGLTSVIIPNSVTSIGYHAFEGCSSLTSVPIPNSVTSIGNLAFKNCSGLTSVTIPNSVTSIGNDAFYGCNGLKSVTIPNSVTSIAHSAFEGCIGMCTINSYPNAANVTLGANVFDGVPQNTCTVHVLPEYLETYKSTAQWINFPNIIGDLKGIAHIPAAVATEASEVKSRSFVANWESVDGAASYDLCVFDCSGDEPSLLEGYPVNTEDGFYEVTGLQPNTQYSYYVVAKDEEGNESPKSNEIEVTTLGRISAPVGLEATDIASASFVANWESVDGAESYDLYVGFLVEGEESATTSSTFADKNLTVGSGETTWATTAAAYGFDSGTNARGAQWSRTSPTLTASIDGANAITRVTIVASTNDDNATVAVTVGGTAYGAAQHIASGTDNYNREYSFTGDASGEIAVSLTNSKSVWVKSIAVEYIVPTGETALELLQGYPVNTEDGFYEVTGLEPNTTYSFYVVARDYNDIEGEHSEIVSVSTANASHGDLNGDGSVDGGDVSILLEMVLAGGVTDAQKAVADLNGDGDVDGGDVSILLEMVLSGD